jgi:hypothetical protein
MSSGQRAAVSRISLIRYIVRGGFLIYLTYLVFQVVALIRSNLSPEAVPKLLESPLPYDFIFFLVLFAVVDTLIGYLQRVLTNTIRNVDETIIGTISSYNNKLTLSELAARFKLKDDELERILSNINIQGEYSIRIDKDTRIVSATPVISLIGAGTKEEKLQKLEELFKEGKISERTYKTLKEKYSKEEA